MVEAQSLTHLLFQSCAQTGKFSQVKDNSGKFPVFNDIHKVVSCQSTEGLTNIRFTLAKYPREAVKEAIADGIKLKQLFQILRKVGTINVLGIEVDKLNHDEALEIVNQIPALAYVKITQFIALHSGNGLHLYFPLSDSLTLDDYDHFQRVFYPKIYDKLAKKLKLERKHHDPGGLKSWASLGRVPNTINEKKNKANQITKREVLPLNVPPPDDYPTWEELTGNILGHPISLKGAILREKVASIEKQRDQEGEEETPKTPLVNCNFITHCVKNSSSITEPQWFSMMRILNNAPNGKLLADYLSKDHPNYSYDEMLDKFEHARPYKAISCGQVHKQFPECKNCPHWRKIQSPAQLLSDNKWLPAKEVNFRKIGVQGQITEAINIDSLCAYLVDLLDDTLARTEDATAIYIWKETHWHSPSEKTFLADYIMPHTSFLGEKISGVSKAVYMNLCVSPKVRIITDSKLAGRPGKIYFKNGILDIKTEALSMHSPDTSCFYSLPFDYEAPDWDSTATWYEFLGELTGSGESGEKKREVLQEHLGSIISGQAPKGNGRCLYIKGGSDNGKSTFTTIIRTLLKDRAAAFDLRGISPNSALHIQNSLVAIDGDFSNTRIKDDGIFKKAVTGDPVSIKKLYSDITDGIVRAKFIVLSNNLPTSQDKSQGFYKRFSFVSFDRTFVKGDQNKPEEISEKCKPAIIAWAIQGYQRLSANKGYFSETLEQEDMTYDMKAKNDPLFYFLDDVIEPVTVHVGGGVHKIDEEHSIETSDILNEYYLWSNRNRVHKAITHRDLVTKLKEYLPVAYTEEYENQKPPVFKSSSIYKVRGIKIKDHDNF